MMAQPKLKENILFLHAATGCKTTSAIFGMGKAKIFNLFDKNPEFVDLIKPFNQDFVHPDMIQTVGEKILLMLYKAPVKNNSLNHYRYTYFAKCTARSKKEVSLASIPPTLGACTQHFLRVYHQLQAWRGISMDAMNWGWHLDDRTKRYAPITTLEKLVPDALLNLVSCNCKKGNCGRNCSCRRAGLPCSYVRGMCTEGTCENSAKKDANEENDWEIDPLDFLELDVQQSEQII